MQSEFGLAISLAFDSTYSDAGILKGRDGTVNFSLVVMLLRAKAAMLSARLSHRAIPSVRPSVCHTGGSGKNGPS